MVSGAAGGIGQACVSALMGCGARLHLIDSNSAVLAELLRTNGATRGLTGACSTLGSREACLSALSGLQHPVYGVLHLAGLYEDDALDSTSRPVWDRAIANNLTSAYDLITACLPRLDPAGGTRIVLTSSLAYRRGSADHASYAAAKGGIAGLVRSLSRRLAPQVLVNGIAPGLVDTAMTRDLIERKGMAVLKDIPLGRPGQADEIASVVAFLLGPGSSYITGQIINCDGGVSNG